MGSGSFAVLTLSAGINSAFAERQRSKRLALLQRPEKVWAGISARPGKERKNQMDSQKSTLAVETRQENTIPRKVGVEIVCSAELGSQFFRGWRPASHSLRNS